MALGLAQRREIYDPPGADPQAFNITTVYPTIREIAIKKDDGLPSSFSIQKLGRF